MTMKNLKSLRRDEKKGKSINQSNISEETIYGYEEEEHIISNLQAKFEKSRQEIKKILKKL